MKNKLLLLVGVLTIGMYVNNQVGAQEKVEDKVADIEEDDGEASDEMPQEGKKRSLVKNTGVKTIEFKNLLAEITDGAADSVSVPFSNSKFVIYYYYNNRNNILYEGTTSEKGEILNLPSKDIPSEVVNLKIRYYLGNDERGYIQKYNKTPYSFLYNFGLKESETSHIINYANKRLRFGVAGDEDSFFYNFQAARINHYFDQAVREYSSAVHSANELLPDTAGFEVAPININFEKGHEGNAFYFNGHDGSKVPDIVIGDRSNRKFPTENLKHNIIHEWSHWNMRRYVGKVGGSYTGHFLYNLNPETSFREGWALFIGDIFAYNYEQGFEDMRVQKDNENGINRLYGKSTNITVQHVLYDLLDTGSNDFNIAHRYLDNEMTDTEVRMLNMGVMYTVLVESKAKTLQDFLIYMEKRYVLTKSDKEKFAKLLEINGLSRDGAFTLDNEGKPLAAPLQETDSISDKDADVVE